MSKKTPQLNMQAITFRLHMNDKLLLSKLLGDDNLSYQSFADACMQAYLRGDPSIIKVIKDWHLLNEVPKDFQEKYTLSHRERAKILDDIAVESVIESPKK